jgi:hypothetical protein
LRGTFSNAILIYTSIPIHLLQGFWLSYLHLIGVHLFPLSISTSPGITGLPAITLDIFHLAPNVIQDIITHFCLKRHSWNLCILAFWAWLINEYLLLILPLSYNRGTKRFKLCCEYDCSDVKVYFERCILIFILDNLWLSFTPPVSWVVWRVRGWIVMSIMFGLH